MNSSVEIWRAKPVRVPYKEMTANKVEVKKEKEDSPVIRRCRKDCIGDLGFEQSKNDPRQPDIKVKCKDESEGKKQKSWWYCFKKTKSQSMISLTKSASTNCCACCCILAAYVKEVIRFMLCCPSDSKVSVLFVELLKMSACVCNDCFNILKGLMRTLFVIKK